ncbi:MAG: metallophosphoesterase [Firmicutes bacterium]|nr:metallophosphoesterase [Bacillota bacterium]
MRKIIAVGDLHGDIYRLIRVLSEQSVIDGNTLEWTVQAENCDLVLLGDYVDWRGEPLEGPYQEWPLGPKKLVEFIYKLYQDNAKLRQEKNFRGRFYPLLGNHEGMMLEGHEIMKRLSELKNKPLQSFQTASAWVDSFVREQLSLKEEEDLMHFLNWYEQGGDKTIQSFGGLPLWFQAVEGEIGIFLRGLPLGVVVNEKLFCHSVPDEKTCWIPIHKQVLSEDSVGKKIREQFLWGRKLWGYDAFLGAPTKPFTESEVDEMLGKMEVKAVLVGHTSLHREKPYFLYGGKIINLDTHGIPGSQAYIEEYEEMVQKTER